MGTRSRRAGARVGASGIVAIETAALMGGAPRGMALRRGRVRFHVEQKGTVPERNILPLPLRERVGGGGRGARGFGGPPARPPPPSPLPQGEGESLLRLRHSWL